MGSHDVFMANIVSVSCREDVLENGRICYDKADLLAYAHGEYFALGEKLGKFGFSTDKENKAAIRSRGGNDSSRTATSKEKGRDDNKKALPQNAKGGDVSEVATPKKKVHRGQVNPPQPKAKNRGKRPFDKPKKSSIKRK
jgi:hypothetical protein